MAIRHLLQRLSPSLDRRWLLALLILGLIALAASFIRWGQEGPPLELVALGPEGEFSDTVRIPASWSDTSTTTPDAVARVPLILGALNPGVDPVRPAELVLSLPLRYRLTGTGRQELEGDVDPGSPLIRYALDPELGPVQPGRLPALLPALDTLWLEVVIPRYYCVALADSIPEFVPAPPAPLGTLSEVRMFYAFRGGDLTERRTGTLLVRLDSSILDVPIAADLPSFEMEADSQAAQPELGALIYAGSRKSRCGAPEDPMELLSTVWETPSGGRFIALDYGGAVRKHLYDLDADGVIERESWDPDGDGDYEATRRAQIPIPEFLLPRTPATGYDLTRLDTLPPDSLARLDPFRGAMQGPGPVPMVPADSPAVIEPPSPDTLPTPSVRRDGPLGRPVQLDRP